MIKINPKLYPFDIVNSAAYMLLDKAYFVIDGDENEITVEITSKKGENVEKEFQNELVKQARLKKDCVESDLKSELLRKALELPKDDFLDDDIIVPWEG